MKLRYSRRALRDLAEISAFVRDRNPVAAERVCESLRDAMQMLVRFPLAGRAQKMADLRKLVARLYHYIIYYIFDDRAGEIRIVTIRHPARQWGNSDA